MKKFMILFFLLGGSAVRAETAWFTVLGDPGNPAADTVEVDPTPVAVSAGVRTLRVRSNRSAQRTSQDGVAYRSYRAEVLFDCINKSAKYVSIDFYLQPLWKGEPYQVSLYTKEDPRWMQFRDIEPNPTRRIVRAVCESASVTNN